MFLNRVSDFFDVDENRQRIRAAFATGDVALLARAQTAVRVRGGDKIRRTPIFLVRQTGFDAENEIFAFSAHPIARVRREQFGNLPVRFDFDEFCGGKTPNNFFGVFPPQKIVVNFFLNENLLKIETHKLVLFEQFRRISDVAGCNSNRF